MPKIMEVQIGGAVRGLRLRTELGASLVVRSFLRPNPDGLVAVRFEDGGLPRTLHAPHTSTYFIAEDVVVLVLISLFVLYEAYEQLRHPSSVASGPMLLVAVVGLIVNAFGILLLRTGSTESLNLKGAYYEVLSDVASSVGVIVAAAVIWFTGWIYRSACLGSDWAVHRAANVAAHDGRRERVARGTPVGLNVAEIRNSTRFLCRW
jgi:hypothetical protein